MYFIFSSQPWIHPIGYIKVITKAHESKALSQGIKASQEARHEGNARLVSGTREIIHGTRGMLGTCYLASFVYLVLDTMNRSADQQFSLKENDTKPAIPKSSMCQHIVLYGRTMSKG